MLLVATSVMSLPARFTSATPSGMVYSSVGHRAFEFVHHLVFEEDHRVVVADGALHQPFGVVGRGRHDDFQAGDVAQPGVQALGMLRRRAAPRAHRRAQDHRHFELAAGHVVNLGRLIDHLVHGQRDEIAEHDVHHRAHAGHRRADASPAMPGFGDRRIDDALGAKFLHQPVTAL